MPDCVIQFDPILPSPFMVERFGMVEGNIYAQSRTLVNGVRILAKPAAFPDTGDVQMQYINCPAETCSRRAVAVPDELGNTIWETTASVGIFPRFITAQVLCIINREGPLGGFPTESLRNIGRGSAGVRDFQPGTMFLEKSEETTTDAGSTQAIYRLRSPDGFWTWPTLKLFLRAIDDRWSLSLDFNSYIVTSFSSTTGLPARLAIASGGGETKFFDTVSIAIRALGGRFSTLWLNGMSIGGVGGISWDGRIMVGIPRTDVLVYDPDTNARGWVDHTDFFVRDSSSKALCYVEQGVSTLGETFYFTDSTCA